jgi:MFS family permease
MTVLGDRVQAKAQERRWLILGVLCFSVLVIVLDNSILNVALPSIVRELNASNSQLQWMVDAYTLVFAGLLLTMGSIGDKFGRRPLSKPASSSLVPGRCSQPCPGQRTS